jgi:hypothetical protein
VRPERPLLGAVPAAGLERGGGAALEHRGASLLVVEVEREQPRVARRDRADPGGREEWWRAVRERFERRLRDPLGGRLVLPAEEDERDVKGLGGNGTDIGP